MRPKSVPWDTYQVIQAWGGLTVREQDILIQRYVNHKTMEEVGHGYGVTRELIRQAEDAALKTLKDILEERVSPERVKNRIANITRQTNK